MQDECVAVDFDYITPEIAVDGVSAIPLTQFIGSEWVTPETDRLWLDNYRKNRILNIQRFERDCSAVNKVVVLVGSSPAVKRQIDTLKGLDEHYIIVACNAVYSYLVQNGVKVDYVFAIEAGWHIGRDLSIQDESTTLIASPFVCPSILHKWTGTKAFYYLGGGNQYHAELLNDGIKDIDVGGGNVVSTAMLWAYKYLAAREFIFIGLSFCYYDDYYFDQRSTTAVGGFDQPPIYTVDMYGQAVKTTMPLMMYKTWIEGYSRLLTGAHFINCTEDGAFGTMPNILSRNGDNVSYTIKYIPWINIVPLTVAVSAYNQKFKEIKENGIR